MIITEGEEGDYFYIIEEGTVDCLKQQGEHFQFVRTLESGCHFGELALIRDTKRTLSVRVTSNSCKVLALNREAFTRILGSIEKYLKKDYADETKDNTD